MTDWRAWVQEYASHPTDIHEHLVYIYDRLVDLEARAVMEIGVRNAESTRAILAALEVTDGNLVSLDLELPVGFPAEPFLDVVDQRWKFYQMDSRTASMTDPIDALFIDSEHGFQTTLIELTKHARNVRPGGIVLLHDVVSFPTVRAAIKWFQAAHDGWEYQQFNNCNGLGVLTNAGSSSQAQASEQQPRHAPSP